MKRQKEMRIIATLMAAVFAMGSMPATGISAKEPVAAAIETTERSVDFNDGWKFQCWLNAGKEKRSYTEDDRELASNAYDDSSWRTLDLPHDWSIKEGVQPSCDMTGKTSSFPRCGFYAALSPMEAILP